MPWRAGALALLLSTPSALPKPAVIDELTLERAIAIAEADHPAAQAARAEANAARGRERQAGLYPNPVFFLQTTDGVLYETLDDAKYVAGLEYALPIGGRIGASAA